LCALLLGGFWCRDLGLGFLLGLVSSRSSMASSSSSNPAAFRRLPELLAPCLGQHQLQSFDFQAADGHFALRQR
jgi:hypothetical protein